MIVWSATHPGSVSIPLFSQPCSWIQQPIARQQRSQGEMFEQFWQLGVKAKNDKCSLAPKRQEINWSEDYGRSTRKRSWMGIGNHSNSWSTALDLVCLVRFTIFHVRSVWLSTLDPAVNHHWPSGCILTVTGCLQIHLSGYKGRFHLHLKSLEIFLDIDFKLKSYVKLYLWI